MLKETILSLYLLFPHWDERTEKFLLKEGITFHHLTDPTVGSRSLNLRDFVHWRERLLELYEEIFLSPPASWA